MNRKKFNQNHNTDFIAGVYGANQAGANARATDVVIEGMNLFREAAERLGAVNPKIAQGNLFEYIEATKFNADAAIKNSSFKAFVTAAEGKPRAAADLIIKDNERIVREVQAKSMNRASNLTNSLSDDKYAEMQKLVPKGNALEVRELAKGRSQYLDESYGDTAKNVTDKLNHNGIESEGTPYVENLWAAENPELYAAITEAKYVAGEALATGANAAVAGFVITGAISGVKNALASSKGEITLEQAIAKTFQDSGNSALRSGAVGTTSTVIRYGATKLGIKELGQLNTSVAIAAGAIDIGVSIYSFAKGEITSEELIERIGQTGTCTTYSLYVGAAGGAVLGSVGAVVGSMAGYLIAASVYQSATAIFKDARLAETEAERVITLCNEACKAMEEQRREFQHSFGINFQARCAEFDACFAAIEVGFANSDYDATTKSLSSFASLFGKRLQFATFKEFDRFMLDLDEPLIL